MAGIVRHGTVTIRFDPKKLNGYAKFEYAASESHTTEIEVPTMHLLGAMAKLLQGVSKCVSDTMQEIEKE